MKMATVTIRMVTLCFNPQERIPAYHSFSDSNAFSTNLENRPESEGRVSSGILPNRDIRSGVTVNETSKLHIVAIIIGVANSFRTFPIIPPLTASGRNTTTITRVIAMAVNIICLQPSIAARNLVFPFSMCVNMFSMTTMESSTRIPTTNDNAISDIMFSE